jgi:hypothetical protein
MLTSTYVFLIGCSWGVKGETKETSSHGLRSNCHGKEPKESPKRKHRIDTPSRMLTSLMINV